MDPLESELHAEWLKAINSNKEEPEKLERIEIVGGGSISDARRIHTNRGTYFVKLNVADQFPGMFEAEADGLEFLQNHSKFHIPKPLATGDTANVQWILMENISSASKKTDYWRKFGEGLAIMHKEFNDTFGYHRDNYLGSLRQTNTPQSSWAEFFVISRLEPQLKMAKDKGEASSEMVRLFEKMFGRADRYFPVEPASALHGDMWTGNYMTDEKGNATVFDPAVYYGHREMDLAMSKLFGGFDKEFYEAYHETYPLEKDWEDRMDIANLYPLLAHLNLFGGSYAFQIIGILRKKV